MDHNNIQNIRLDVFSSTSKKTQFIYDDFNKGGVAFALYKKYKLKEENWLTLILLVGDIILGFYKIEDTVPLLLQELDLEDETAALLGAEVLDFLKPLSDPNWEPPIETEAAVLNITVNEPLENVNETVVEREIAAKLTELSESFNYQQPIPNFIIPNNLQAGRAVTKEEAIQSSEIHTMASDASLARSPERNSYQPVPNEADEVVHTSNQPDTRESLSNLPAYTNGAPVTTPTAPPITPEPPRWGS